MSISISKFNALNIFMSEVNLPTTIDDLNILLQSTLASFSVKHLLCISSFGMPALQDRKPMFGFRHSDWVLHYRKNKYYLDDALPQIAMRMKRLDTSPLWWSDLVAQNSLSNLQMKVFREAHDFGLTEGLVVPLHVIVDAEGDVTEYAYVSLGGNIAKSSELENTLSLIVTVAHRTARKILMLQYANMGKKFVPDPEIRFSPNVDFSVLANRELEVIRQYVDNETLEQVGNAMNIKVTTVKTHLQNARQKLGYSSNKEMMVALLRHREIS